MLAWLLAILAVALFLYVYLTTLRVPALALEGAHVIVTGGSSGIGLELGIELAKRGSNVSIVARNVANLKSAHEKIDAVKKSPSQNIAWYSCDVSSADDIKRVIETAARSNGNTIDALLCSAGITHVHRFMESDTDHIAKVMNINFAGSAYATRAAVPFMQGRGGRIVYVSSILGLMGCPGYAVYCGSKFALKGFAEALQSELAPWNIYLSVAVPSNVDTPMFEEEEKTKPPETKAIEEGQKPVHPKQVSEDIIRCLEHYRFLVPTSTDPWLLSNFSAGFAPASFKEFLAQPMLAVIGRFAALWETAKYRKTCKKFNKAF